MKKTLIIMLFSMLTFVKATNAQPSVPDTLAYLQSIVANKAQFIGQPFSVLKDSLKIQIKFFSPFASIPHDKTKETSTSFSFYFSQSTTDHYLTYPRLRISWYPYLNATQSNTLFDTVDGAWTSAVIAFYAPGIISDIKILE